MPSTKFPQAEITNGLIHARLYLPDHIKGYYQGTRFDWSGNMYSLEYKGHRYFDQWFKNYSPEIHDVIMGPVQDFTPVDYDEIAPGENFLKIGVGMVRKQDDKPYHFAGTYKLMNGGKWTVRENPDNIVFIHDLADKKFSYHYEKTVQLVKDKPELIISHKLKNNGSKKIETSVYDHNFFMMDKTQIGPGVVVKFPFELRPDSNGVGEIGVGVFAEIKGKEIVFLKPIGTGEEVEWPSLAGFGPTKEDYEIIIENNLAGAGVRITCDQPLCHLALWSCGTTACPEPYIKVKADPGEETTWKIRYEFYTLKH
jgi:hypothetical protein